MKRHAMPQTKEGKWAFGLALAFLVLMLLKGSEAVSLPLPTPLIALSGFASLILGVLAFVRKDRSYGVLYALAIGILVLAWTLAELLIPH